MLGNPYIGHYCGPSSHYWLNDYKCPTRAIGTDGTWQVCLWLEQVLDIINNANLRQQLSVQNSAMFKLFRFITGCFAKPPSQMLPVSTRPSAPGWLFLGLGAIWWPCPATWLMLGVLGGNTTGTRNQTHLQWYRVTKVRRLTVWQWPFCNWICTK